LELDEAKELLERARVEERQAKLNLEKVLQDNYLREEEILRLNRLLLEQREKEELEIWTTKERFDECLIKTLEERGAEITEVDQHHHYLFIISFLHYLICHYYFTISC